MSEEANVAHLQEKIKATKRKQRGADVIVGSGLFSIALDLALTLVRPDLLNISNRVFW